MEIKLTEKEVKDILKQHLQQKFRCVGEIEIQVGAKYICANQYDGYHEGVFQGVKCTVDV
ncbi:hypothetical protein JDW21_19300 [Bacillus subtilis]|uniref:Uncharacterized protein n=1 Tax=Bacillus phage vB_BsuS_PJN02 TaxID=2920374 RepID=A0AC61TRZ8_9CAUD|nr:MULTISPECIES: hypothetical protein [Bacillus subtilis group]YP_010681734.1 hypothetical protein PQE76_gp116 [Bacillus phage vB_BsuS_PJN02]MCR4362042.1 hypothetical protein [Bacillus subtilis]UNH58459.1 hypothetical protein [Bacillus phage vB_BsuS_PJN02]UQB84342.1 hypothetical protein KMZ31_19675 [Bacillus amyloliquefaciens]WOF32979.1 hypothetical protein OEJ84_22915 [Bacillus subtilis]